MTERLADVSARIEGIRQLGTVVNAMKGIAAARARVARTQIEAVDSYAATIAAAMSSALAHGGPSDNSGPAQDVRAGRVGLLVFCAEQGFAGAFSEHVLDSIGAELKTARLLLIGTRGLAIAAASGLAPFWTAPMPSHAPGIPKLADGITKAIYRGVEEGHIERLDAIFAGWKLGQMQVLRKTLFPIDLSDFSSSATEDPLIQLPFGTLIAGLSADYVHAQVCKTALHAFAAENEARVEAMSAAGNQIARELELFQATLRRVRQEAITAEIIELGTDAETARGIR